MLRRSRTTPWQGRNPSVHGACSHRRSPGATGRFCRRFSRAISPTYSVGFNLNVPIRNRAAQADYINSELVLRQQQPAVQRMENQVRVEVQNAVIGLQQARAQYQSAVEQRVLEEQTLDAEQKKLAMGVSTTYNVILVQRDLVTAQSNEVAAQRLCQGPRGDGPRDRTDPLQQQHLDG